VIFVVKEPKKPVTVSFKTTQEMVDNIEIFQEQKSKELGVLITKNQAIELLIVEGLNANKK
jgi:hypothetical protein